MGHEMSTGKEVNPEIYNQDITAFLNPASVTVPEARMAIKLRCYAGKGLVAGSKLLPSQEAPSQNGLFYVAQRPEDVDYTINITLGEPLPHSKITNIKCQIVYDPGSDNCFIINRTTNDLVVFNHQTPRTFQIMTIDGISTIQPGVWEIKLHSADNTTQNDSLVEILLRERRHTIAITQLNDTLQNQEVEDGERSTKRQKHNASLTMDVVRHASNLAADWKLGAKNNANSSFFDLHNGDFATIHAPLSMTEFQTEYSPARYKIKRINTISDKPTSKIFCCEHSLISEKVLLKVIPYKNKTPRDLIRLSELWRREKSILNKLNHRNIISLKAFDGRMLALFLEFLPPSLAQGRDSPFIPYDVSRILKTISSALIYLEANGIVHNDIKPSNIAYSSDRGAVIFDFENASLSNEAKLCGSPWYMPPELVHDSRRYSAGDVWAFGIIMLYLLKKIQYPETVVESWNVYELRQRASKSAKQMKLWLDFIKKAREDLDQANPIEYVTFRMLDEDQHSRITVAAIQNKVEHVQ
ncbi:hypothetical protein MKX08_003358 [Trichoderma sp. CBMAI-0020]|nr:hypothetical protein MKX08_003358 [Trichoderma sp. CBMAI-0020]